MIVKTTEVYNNWFKKLRNELAKATIVRRIRRIEQDGFFGDHKTFDGIGELRIDTGPGYRVYYVQRGEMIILLLCGGNKDSQQKDIAKAKEIAKGI
jgi:putative addiction module killer protein